MSEFSAEVIEGALAGRRLGHPVLFLDSVGSTNDIARQEAGAGAQEGLLVIADEQTAGRGRYERRWWAPRGSSLLMSLLLRPPLPLARAGQPAMCLGLGAVEGIELVTGLRPAIKWPNDLVLPHGVAGTPAGGTKLAGMLADMGTSGDRLDFIVLGLGLNVNLEFGQDYAGPPDVLATATSLQSALGHPVDRLTLLAAILERCEYWYQGLLSGQSPHMAYSERLDTLGKAVRVSTSGPTLEGVAVGVTSEGALQLQKADGSVVTVWAGDVTSLRPAARS